MIIDRCRDIEELKKLYKSRPMPSQYEFDWLVKNPNLFCFYDEKTGKLRGFITIQNEEGEALQKPKAMQYFENVIEDMRGHVPDEIANEMYTKLYSVLEDSTKLDKANYTVTPKELYDINKNISDMSYCFKRYVQ